MDKEQIIEITKEVILSLENEDANTCVQLDAIKHNYKFIIFTATITKENRCPKTIS